MVLLGDTLTLEADSQVGDILNCKYAGYKVGRLIFYNEDAYPYFILMINNKGD